MKLLDNTTEGYPESVSSVFGYTLIQTRDCQHAVPRNVHKLLCGIIKAKYVLFEGKINTSWDKQQFFGTQRLSI